MNFSLIETPLSASTIPSAFLLKHPGGVVLLDPVRLCAASSCKIEEAARYGDPEGDMRRLVLIQNFSNRVYAAWMASVAENQRKQLECNQVETSIEPVSERVDTSLKSSESEQVIEEEIIIIEEEEVEESSQVSCMNETPSETTSVMNTSPVKVIPQDIPPKRSLRRKNKVYFNTLPELEQIRLQWQQSLSPQFHTVQDCRYPSSPRSNLASKTDVSHTSVPTGTTLHSDATRASSTSYSLSGGQYRFERVNEPSTVSSNSSSKLTSRLAKWLHLSSNHVSISPSPSKQGKPKAKVSIISQLKKSWKKPKKAGMEKTYPTTESGSSEVTLVGQDEILLDAKQETKHPVLERAFDGVFNMSWTLSK